MKKKLKVFLVTSIILVLCISMSIFASTVFKDVDGTKYESAVEYLYEKGIVDGYPDGTFLPDNVVTRAEFVKYLVTACGISNIAQTYTGETEFTDISGHWAENYINVAAEYDFLNGYPDGTFLPNENTTYAYATQWCYRALTGRVASSGNYMSRARKLGLLDDVEYDNESGDITRGEACILLRNMMKIKNKNKVQFFIIQSEVERVDSKTYSIMLENEDSLDEYQFANGTGEEVAKELYDKEIEGYFAVVTLNDDGEISDLELITRVKGEFKNEEELLLLIIFKRN